MIKQKRLSITTRAMLINISVSLLIVLLFALLLLFRQTQMQQHLDGLKLASAASVKHRVTSMQAALVNEAQLLGHNEDLMDRLMQAAMEQNAQPLPLPQRVLKHLDLDAMRLYSVDGIIVARYGAVLDLIPKGLTDRAFNGLVKTAQGLLLLSRQQVLYNRTLIGYLEVARLLNVKELTDQDGMNAVSLTLVANPVQQPLQQVDDDIFTVSLANDSLTGTPITLDLSIDHTTEQQVIYLYYAGMLLALFLVIGAWWYLYHRLIGDILKGLDTTARQLEAMGDGDVWPQPEQVVDGVDQIRLALHQMSIRLRLKADRLQAERQVLRAVTDAAPIWIWMANHSGHVDFINRTMQMALGNETADAVALSKLFRRTDGSLCDPGNAGLDCLVKAGIGEHVLDMHLITVAQGNDTIGLAIDMTDYLELEASLRQAHKMEALGTLVGGVAHNFNNMLAAMSGRIYMAQRRAADMPDVLAELAKLNSNVTAAADMVKQLMAFVHKDVVMKEELSLSRAINEAVDTARMGMPEDVRLDINICPDELAVFGDASALQQVCLNLMVNARDALTGMDKMIGVRLQRLASNEQMHSKRPDLAATAVARLTVEDNGSGISREKLEHIFEPFYTTKEMGQGTGLGLSMSLGTIESHGGWIEVDSTPDKGTCFHIFIPLLSEAMKPALQPTRQPVTEGNGELILFVDDQPELRGVGEGMLSAMGYRVLLAENGRQALELFHLHGEDISLVMTDVIMPEMGGVELYRALRRAHAKVPLLFVSGYDADSLNLPLPANYKVLQKPYPVTEVAGLIQTMLG
ncbi:MAG: ATP-binding protein [Mariprofundus sp.]